MTQDEFIPVPPEITSEQLESCRNSGDYCPVLFEWYKYVGRLCIFFASINIDSPAIRPIKNIHYGVLVGLLTRCGRLMFSNVVLSSEDGLFGETTSILDRCIFESAMKIKWLANKGTEEAFDRLIADGLKTEIVFKDKINENILSRGGQPLEIERRMLTSIDNYIASSMLSEEQITQFKKLPDLAAMVDSVGHVRTLYIVGQKMGSHHVHGTWSSLLLHYLEDENGRYSPRDHDCYTHVNQYIFVPLFILEAIRDFISYVFPDSKDAEALIQLLESVAEEIHKINTEVVGSDFEKT